MNYKWIEDYCNAKKGTISEYKIDWEANRFMLAGKMFALIGEDKNKEPIITLKCDPEFGNVMKERYKHITEGYYMNKVHWCSIYLESDVPVEVIKQLIDMSYELILKSLPKKKQMELLS
ncbi:MAG: MmcQ/YjbR family DNA-binding protein [Candidatus Cloacimonetes bacterium]|nr:MmcQ/YjbR family DNA-binding protein [Candidatus Cloacimonadota bacterium]